MADEEAPAKDPQAHDYFAESQNSSKFDEDDTVNKVKYEQDLALAFKRSVVQGMPFDKNQKLEMMEYVPPKPQSPFKDLRNDRAFTPNKEFQESGEKLLHNLPTDRLAQTPNNVKSKHQVHPKRISKDSKDKITAIKSNQLINTTSTFQDNKQTVNLGLMIETSLESDRNGQPRDSTKGLMKTNNAFNQGKIVVDDDTARGVNDPEIDNLEQELNEVTQDKEDIYKD